MVKIADGSGDRSENVTPELADALSVALGGEPARGAAGFAFNGLGGHPHTGPSARGGERLPPIPAASPIPPASALPAASPIPPSTPSPTPEGPLERRHQMTSFRKLSFKVLSRRHRGWRREHAQPAHSPTA